MYSNNDFRSYSENHLEHSWGTKPAQKAREKEYNAWYYATHPEKWGVKKALENLEDKVDDKVSDALDKGLLGKTDIDNNLYNAGKSAYSKLKKKTESAIVNTGKKNLTSSAMKLEKAKRDYEANRNAATANAYHKAQQEYNATKRGKMERAIDDGPSVSYNTKARATAQARKAGNAVGTAVDNVKDRINTAVRNSNTKIDDNLLGAARAVRRGDTSAARTHLGNVGREVRNTVDNTKRSINDRINTAVRNTDTRIDDNLLGAARAVRRGDTSAAKTHLGNVGREVRNDVKRGAGAVVSATKGRATKVGNDYNTANATRKAIESGARDPETLRRNAEASRTLGGRAANAADAVKRAGETVSNAAKSTSRNVANAAGKNERDLRDTTRQAADDQARRFEDARRSGNTAEAARLATSRSNFEAAAKAAQSDYNKTFMGIAERAAGVAGGVASRAVNSASSSIDAFRDAVAKYGSDSPQAQRWYERAIEDIMDAISYDNASSTNGSKKVSSGVKEINVKPITVKPIKTNTIETERIIPENIITENILRENIEEENRIGGKKRKR